jgi:hypothetical protein
MLGAHCSGMNVDTLQSGRKAEVLVLMATTSICSTLFPGTLPHCQLRGYHRGGMEEVSGIRRNSQLSLACVPGAGTMEILFGQVDLCSLT